MRCSLAWGSPGSDSHNILHAGLSDVMVLQEEQGLTEVTALLTAGSRGQHCFVGRGLSHHPAAPQSQYRSSGDILRQPLTPKHLWSASDGFSLLPSKVWVLSSEMVTVTSSKK